MTESFSHKVSIFFFFSTNSDFENLFFTYRNWSCGSLKSLDGSTVNLFLFSFRTSRELEMFSKQPGSRILILLLLKFLCGKMSKSPQCTQTQNAIRTEHKMYLFYLTDILVALWERILLWSQRRSWMSGPECPRKHMAAAHAWTDQRFDCGL